MTDRIKWCRHHTQPKPMCDNCDIGVDVEALVGKFGQYGRHFRLPCHDRTHADVAKIACPAGGPEWLTDAEIAHQDSESDRCVQEFLNRLAVLQPLIAEIKAGKTEAGEGPCPCCNSGMLRWSMSTYNRHVRMRCSTDDCINFME